MPTTTERAAAFSRAKETILDAQLSREAAEAIRAGLDAQGLCDETLWSKFLARHKFPPNGASPAEREPGEDDDPTPAPPDEWPELDDAALYGPAGDFVSTILPETEADPVALLVHFLLFFGNVIGRQAHAEAGQAEHHANLFAVIVADTASGKGTAAAAARKVFRLTDPDWEKRLGGGLSSGEGLIYAVRDDVVKETEKDGKLHVERIEGVEDKRLCPIETEFAKTLRVMGRDQSILGAILRQAWDGTEVLQTMVKKDPSKATGAHISVVGHITPDELRRELDSTEAANGFGNRFIWICAKRSKYLPEGGNLPDAALDPLARKLRVAIDNARGRGLGRVSRDDEARALWGERYQRLADVGPGLWGAMSARGAPTVLRLSLLYALLDNVKQIGVPHLRAALALWDYNVLSVKRLFGDSVGDPDADKLLEALRSRPDGLTREDIRSGVFAGHISSGRHDAVISLLVRLNRIASATVSTGGRAATRWSLIP